MLGHYAKNKHNIYITKDYGYHSLAQLLLGFYSIVYTTVFDQVYQVWSRHACTPASYYT